MAQKYEMLEALETPPPRTRRTKAGNNGLQDIQKMDIPVDTDQWRAFVGTLKELKSVRGKIFNTLRNASNDDVRNAFGAVVEPESRTLPIDNKGTHKLFVRFVTRMDEPAENAS